MAGLYEFPALVAYSNFIGLCNLYATNKRAQHDTNSLNKNGKERMTHMTRERDYLTKHCVSVEIWLCALIFSVVH